MGREFINNTWTTRWDMEMASWFRLNDSAPFKFSFPPNKYGRTDMYTIYYKINTLNIKPEFPDNLFEMPSGCVEKR